MRPAKTQISLGIRPVWSEFSLSAWRKLVSLATLWVHSEDSEQTGRMPRLIREYSLGAPSLCWFYHVAAHIFIVFLYCERFLQLFKLCVYETAASKELSWVPSRDQVSPDFMRTEDALAVFWFTCRDAAEHFFACRHENRFKEPQFPEPDGHESFYCPLIIAPSASKYSIFTASGVGVSGGNTAFGFFF